MRCGSRSSATVSRHGRRARPAPWRLAAERDAATRRGRRHVDADLLEPVFFHAAVLDVPDVAAARAVAAATHAAAAPAVAPPEADSTTETVRHKAVDDRVGAAVHVRKQVGS